MSGFSKPTLPMTGEEAARARRLLCALGDFVRDKVVVGRENRSTADLAGIARESVADTIYAIDTISEEAITEWFAVHWPPEWPVELVAEGFDDPATRLFPRGTKIDETRWRCVVDPIDGTRCIMYDKRPAWVLAGLAPQRGEQTRLPDIFVAAMTEIPTRKQWRADQVSAVRGAGLVSEGIDVRTKARTELILRPSQAGDFRHGFASMAKFFPAGKTVAAALEEGLWRDMYAGPEWPVIFDDQYLSTGGQFYELLAGHDRMNGDLRPMILERLGIETALVCHPYDVCTALLLEEAGIVFEDPAGGPVDVPLDLTSPVAWVGYANETLAELVRPVLRRLVKGLGLP
jgi:fructose-1,6-bisphosphatase/inositol monophosphatase family enzyme